MNWATIRYRDFYDIPRIFIVTLNGKLFLFDCAFDDEIDDYSELSRLSTARDSRR